MNEVKGIHTVNIDVHKELLRVFNIPKDTGYGPFILGITPFFNEYAKHAGLQIPQKKYSVGFIWFLEYLWLAIIIPIRKIRFFGLKILRGVNKVKKV